jgi:hypothetical protein
LETAIVWRVVTRRIPIVRRASSGVIGITGTVVRKIISDIV